VAAFASVRHGLIGFNVRIAPDYISGCMDAVAQTLQPGWAALGYDRGTVRRRYIVCRVCPARNERNMNMKTPLILTALAAMISVTPLTAQETIVRETTTAVQPTEIVGTVTELVPDALVVRTQEATAPVRYTFTKTTEYVDELGNRVTRESIKTGLPVTVRYIKEGDRMIVNRVVVRKAAPPPVTIEKRTTTTTTTEEEDDD